MLGLKKTYGSRDVGAGNTLGGGVEEVEGGRLADLGNDLGANTEGFAGSAGCWTSVKSTKRTREATLDSNKVVGLLDRGGDGVNVEGTDRAGAVSFCLAIKHVLLFQLTGG